MKLSVIIVAYKSADYIADCLQSIRKHNDLGEDLEVVVVDNSPEGDKTGEVVQTLHPEVRYIKNLKNGGFGAGNNLGIRESRGEYALLLNPDTEIIEPVFKWACDTFDRNQDIGLFGVRLVDKQLRPVQSFCFLPDQYNLFNSFFPISEWRNTINLPPRRLFTVGADLFVRRSVLSEVGLLDENMFLYFEECDLFYRAHQHGYQLRYFPGKKIVHLEGKSSSDMSRAKYRYYFSSLQYIINKHQGHVPALKNKLAMIEHVYQLKYYLTRRQKFKQLADDLHEIRKGSLCSTLKESV